MPRLFVESAQVRGGVATLVGADARHIAGPLRARPGEMVVIVESGTTEHGLCLEQVAPTRVSGRIVWSRPATGEPRVAINVVQALPQRGMDDTVACLAEVGATDIWPAVTARTVVHPKPDAAEGKVERWRRIALQAAQLSGRARPPVVHPIHTLTDVVEHIAESARLLACVADQSARPLSRLDVDATTPVGLVIGPEGGLDAREREALGAAGSVEVHLGPRVIPTWFAGSIAVAMLLGRMGELDAPVSPLPQ